MSNNRGYIYVLANSAMPDLIKVGKTTRAPVERAKELSQVTGIPTPFIVVYEQLVNNCDTAEEFLHTILKQKGYRESENREFFRASASEVIKIIVKTSDPAFDPISVLDEKDDECDDENEGEHCEGEYQKYPWSNILEMAVGYRRGDDGYIQDNEEAVKLYKEAIKLGWLQGYINLAGLYEDMYSGTPNEFKQVMECLQEGSKKGNYYCYSKMAIIFLYQRNFDNAYKSFNLFLKNRSINMKNILEEENYLDCEISDFFFNYFSFCSEINSDNHSLLLDIANQIKYYDNKYFSNRECYPCDCKDFLLEEFSRYIEICVDKDDIFDKIRYKRGYEWVKKYM